jgi:hypothetical protein
VSGRQFRYGGAGRPWSAAPRPQKGEDTRSAAERALVEPYRTGTGRNRVTHETGALNELVRNGVIQGWLYQDGVTRGGDTHRLFGLLNSMGQVDTADLPRLTFPLYAYGQAPIRGADGYEYGRTEPVAVKVGEYTPDALLDLGEGARPHPFCLLEIKGRMNERTPMLLRLLLGTWGHVFQLHVVEGRVRDVAAYDPLHWTPARLSKGRLVRQIGKLIT